MKGALASLTVALTVLMDSSVRLRRNVTFHSVADEESGGTYGTRYLISRGLVKAEEVVVMEGSVKHSNVFVRPAVRGACWLRVETYGKAAHASNPGSGINAVLQKNVKTSFGTS